MSKDRASPIGREKRSGPAHRAGAAPWLALGAVSLLMFSIARGGSPPGWLLTSAVVLSVATLIVARTGDADRWRSVAIWPVILIASVAALSIATSEAPSLSLERAAPMTGYLLLVPIVQVLCWSGTAIRILGGVAITVIIALDVATVIDLVGTWSNENVRWQDDRVTGPFGNPNDLAVSALLLPIGALIVPDRWRFAGTLGLAVIAVPSWLVSLSRQALLGWVVATLALLRPSPRRRRTWIVGVVGVAITATAIVLNPMARERAMNTIKGHDGGRTTLYAYGVSLATQHPVTGIGPALFGEYYVQDALDGWSWRGRALQKQGMPWVHSLPIEIVVETGVVGGVAFACVAIAAVRRLRRDDERSPDHRRLAWAASSGLLVILVVGLVDLSFIKSWCHIVIWTTVGLAFAVPPRSTETPKPPIEG